MKVVMFFRIKKKFLPQSPCPHRVFRIAVENRLGLTTPQMRITQKRLPPSRGCASTLENKNP